MLRYNLVVSCLIGLIFPQWSAAADTIALPTLSSGTAPELKIPKGFSLAGHTLTLPNGQVIKDVTGVQECGRLVLVVSSREVGVYNSSQRKYAPLSPELPLGIVHGQFEFVLLPFNTAASSDPKAGERTAFVALKGAEELRAGVYQYTAGQTNLVYLPLFGSHGRVRGRYQAWHTFMTDIKNETPHKAISIDMDLTGEHSGYYSVQRIGGRTVLRRITPPSPEQVVQMQETALAEYMKKHPKMRVWPENPTLTQVPANLLPPSEEPDKK